MVQIWHKLAKIVLQVLETNNSSKANELILQKIIIIFLVIIILTFITIFSDEHSLIAQYCQNLNNGDYSSIVPDSPMQLMEEINHDQTRELEHMIRELESENATLQEEYAHLKATSSSSSGTTTSGVSISTYTSGAVVSSSTASDVSSKANDILTEAKLLREHKERLESRMKVLEEHNQQLISQLGKLKHYISPSEGTLSISGEGLSSSNANKTGTLNIKSVTASQLAQVMFNLYQWLQT